MKLIAFAVFDTKAESYGMPMFLQTKGVALRSFADACADPKSPMAQHPSDFTLYEIGEYDQNKGELIDVSPAKFVVAASSVVELLSAAGRPPAPKPAKESK